MSNRLYIGKIGSIAPEELLKVCQQFGNVVDFLQKDNFAFVQYASDKEAQDALIELDGSLFSRPSFTQFSFTGRSISGQRIIAEIALAKVVDQHHFDAHPR